MAMLVKGERPRRSPEVFREVAVLLRPRTAAPLLEAFVEVSLVKPHRAPLPAHESALSPVPLEALVREHVRSVRDGC